MESLRGVPARREFERFAAEATASLLRTGYLVTSDLAEAEDLAQETLLRTQKVAQRKEDGLPAGVCPACIDAELNVTDTTPLETREDQRVEQNLIAIEVRDRTRSCPHPTLKY
jgi:hypothetical protein